MEVLVQRGSLSSSSSDSTYSPPQSPANSSDSPSWSTDNDSDSSDTTLEENYPAISKSRSADANVNKQPHSQASIAANDSDTSICSIDSATGLGSTSLNVSSNQTIDRSGTRFASESSNMKSTLNSTTSIKKEWLQEDFSNLSLEDDPAGIVAVVSRKSWQPQVAMSKTNLAQNAQRIVSPKLSAFALNVKPEVKDVSLEEIQGKFEEINIEKAAEYIQQSLQKCNERRLILENLLSTVKSQEELLDDHLKTCETLATKLAKESGNVKKVLIRRNLKITEKAAKLIGFMHNTMEPLKNWNMLDQARKLCKTYTTHAYLQGDKILKWESKYVDQSFSHLQKNNFTEILEVYGISWQIVVESNAVPQGPTTVLISLLCLGLPKKGNEKEEKRLKFSVSVQGKIEVAVESIIGKQECYSDTFNFSGQQPFAFQSRPVQKPLTTFKCFPPPPKGEFDMGHKCCLRCHLFVSQPLSLSAEHLQLVDK